MSTRSHTRRSGRPRTAQEFLERIHTLVSTGRDHEALAFAEQTSRDFLPQLTAEELNRLSATMEGVQMMVDLEEWDAPRAEPPEPPATASVAEEHEPGAPREPALSSPERA